MTFARRLGFLVFVACALAIAVPTWAAECPQTSVSDGMRTLVAKNAPPWDSLRIWERQPPTPAAAAEAEVARIGGSRLLLEIDRNDIRRELLDTLRTETIRVLRKEKIVWARAPAIRDNSVEVQIRDAENFQRALKLFAEEIAFPIETTSARTAEISDLGNGLVRLTPGEAEITARVDGVQLNSMRILERRAQGLGISGARIWPAGFGRIRAVVPGLLDPSQLINPLYMLARLEFRLVDVSVDPCEAANGPVPQDSEAVFREEGKRPVPLKKHAFVGPGDMVDAVVALAPPADQPTVVFRLTATAGYRFAKVTQENVGRSFAVVLDGRVIAIVRIAEPLGGRVQLWDGLGLNDAEQLSLLLSAATWPSRLVIVEQQFVLPSDQ